MQDSSGSEFNRVVFDSGLVRIGAFRCHPEHASFHNSGPARNYCFVFPRTAVEIQHEHERAFVANPNVVTFYNRGQAYLRNAISSEGDHCDWFGARVDVVQDVVRAFDPAAADSGIPFRFTRAWVDAGTYLAQRRVFNYIARGAAEALAVEESVIGILERIVRSGYRAAAQPPERSSGSNHRDIVHHVEFCLSQSWGERLTLGDVAGEVGVSPYQLCRLFRRGTGTTVHRYRQKLHLRASLEGVVEASRRLIDIALDAGFSSHSHFTSSFRGEFGITPSTVRVRAGSDRSAHSRPI